LFLLEPSESEVKHLQLLRKTTLYVLHEKVLTVCSQKTLGLKEFSSPVAKAMEKTVFHKTFLILIKRFTHVFYIRGVAGFGIKRKKGERKVF